MLSAPAQFDAQFTAKSSAAKSASKRCIFYEHDVTHEATWIDDDVFYDIDSDLNNIYAYNNANKNKVFDYLKLTSDQCHCLSTEAQINWVKFTLAEKPAIMEEVLKYIWN